MTLVAEMGLALLPPSCHSRIVGESHIIPWSARSSYAVVCCVDVELLTYLTPHRLEPSSHTPSEAASLSSRDKIKERPHHISPSLIGSVSQEGILFEVKAPKANRIVTMKLYIGA